MDGLISILDFAKIVGVKASTLRYYDEIGLFSPISRGADNNYRYYAPQQFTMYNLVRVLTSLKVPLNTIITTKESRTPESVLKLLEEQEAAIASEVERLQALYAIIHTISNLISTGLGADKDKITVENMDAMPITLGRTNNFEGESFFSAFTEFCVNAPLSGINLSYPVGGFFENMQVFSEAPSQPQQFFSVDPNGRDIKAKDLYLIAYTKGYYGKTNDVANRILKFADENNLEFCGPVYNIYLFDEVSVQNFSDYLLQVSVAVRTRR